MLAAGDAGAGTRAVPSFGIVGPPRETGASRTRQSGCLFKDCAHGTAWSWITSPVTKRRT
jgi:hypothetical protein